MHGPKGTLGSTHATEVPELFISIDHTPFSSIFFFPFYEDNCVAAIPSIP